MQQDYIIDFERVNQLTAHPNDDPSKSSGFAAPFTYSISRKILKEYLEIYIGYNPSESYKIGNRTRTVPIEQYNNIIETLKHNKILISSADIRNEKINSILDEED